MGGPLHQCDAAAAKRRMRRAGCPEDERGDAPGCPRLLKELTHLQQGGGQMGAGPARDGSSRLLTYKVVDGAARSTHRLQPKVVPEGGAVLAVVEQAHAAGQGWGWGTWRAGRGRDLRWPSRLRGKASRNHQASGVRGQGTSAQRLCVAGTAS